MAESLNMAVVFVAEVFGAAVIALVPIPDDWISGDG
jgi:hypothetical protein